MLVLLRGAEGRGAPVPLLGRGVEVLFRAPALPVPDGLAVVFLAAGFLADGRLGAVFFAAFHPVPHTMQDRSLRALFVSH